MVKDPSALHAAFSHDADYIKVLGADSLTSFAFWDYSPELSRRFRALKIWMTIKQYGAIALGQAIEENIRLSKRLGTLVEQSDDFELLAPIVLSIVCFRYVPATIRKEMATHSFDTSGYLRLRVLKLDETEKRKSKGKGVRKRAAKKK